MDTGISNDLWDTYRLWGRGIPQLFNKWPVLKLESFTRQSRFLASLGSARSRSGKSHSEWVPSWRPWAGDEWRQPPPSSGAPAFPRSPQTPFCFSRLTCPFKILVTSVSMLSLQAPFCGGAGKKPRWQVSGGASGDGAYERVSRKGERGEIESLKDKPFYVSDTN